MQDHPKAPGNARQGTPGTDGPAACGGAAAQSPAPGHTRPRATPMPMPMPMPKARNHARSRAAPMPMPNVPGHADRGLVRAGPSVPLPTIPWPAWVRRLLPEVLRRVAVTPRTRPLSPPTDRLARAAADPVYPARPVPTRPPPTTAGAGYPRHRHSRAPPRAAHRQPTLVSFCPPAWQADVRRYPTAARRSAWSACASAVMRLSRAPSRMLGRLLVVRRTR